MLKKQLDAQQTQLDKITQSLSAVASDTTSTPTIVVTGKGKGKQKEEAFYTVNICHLYTIIDDKLIVL